MPLWCETDVEVTYSSKCVYDEELLSMEVEDLFDVSEHECSFDNSITSNKASNKAKQEHCIHGQYLVSKSTFYRHKILHGGDSSDLSTKTDEIFDVNCDSDGEGHTEGDNVEIRSVLSLGISELPTELPKILEGNNAESAQALESIRK